VDCASRCASVRALLPDVVLSLKTASSSGQNGSSSSNFSFGVTRFTGLPTGLAPSVAAQLRR
jgi:hypothetical protein